MLIYIFTNAVELSIVIKNLIDENWMVNSVTNQAQQIC